MIQTTTATAAPPARATGIRSRRRHRLKFSSKRTGIRRSTSTKTIIETVSTQNWVSARSGAPWATKSSAVPYPVRPAKTTAFIRRRTPRHSRAAAQVSRATAAWAGWSHRRGAGTSVQGSSATSTAICPARTTLMVVTRYTDSEPRCTNPVHWRAVRSRASSIRPKTRSAERQASR